MSLPETYDQHLRNALRARAVWLPGDSMNLGDIVQRRGGIFVEPQGNLKEDFGIEFRVGDDAAGRNLNVVTSRVRQRLFQANAELPAGAQLDPEARAELRYEFGGKSQFVLKTPSLRGSAIKNMMVIAKKIAALPGWNHDDFFIVQKIFSADEWSFIGTEQRQSSFSISGKGSGIAGFLTAGASAGLSGSGSIDVNSMGATGPIAMNVARVKEDGALELF